MAASQPHARRRRRPRRGSLQRPVNARLYRAAFLLVLLPLLLLAFTVTRPVPLAKPPLPGGVRHVRRARHRHRPRRPVPRPCAGQPGGNCGRRLVRERVDAVRAHRRPRPLAGDDPRSRQGAPDEPDRRRAGRVPRRDRRDGTPRRPRRRRRRERQRKWDGGADRARAGLRPAGDRGQRARPVAAYDRLPVDRRRLVREPRGRSLRRALPVPRPDHRRGQPRCDRGRRPAAARDRRPAAALTEPQADRHRRRACRGAERQGSRARELLRPADRSRLPVHARRAGGRDRRGAARDHAHDRGRPPPAGIRRYAGPARLGAARADGPLGPAARRLAQPGARDRAEDDELRARGRPRRARLDDRARAGAAAGALHRRDRRSLRALPPTPDRLQAGAARAPQPACLLAVRRHRFHVFSSARRLADRTSAAAQPGDRGGGRLAGGRARRLPGRGRLRAGW